MNRKALITTGMIVGSLVGGYVPSFFGVDAFSFTSAILGTIGALVGIWIGYRLSE